MELEEYLQVAARLANIAVALQKEGFKVTAEISPCREKVRLTCTRLNALNGSYAGAGKDFTMAEVMQPNALVETVHQIKAAFNSEPPHEAFTLLDRVATLTHFGSYALKDSYAVDQYIKSITSNHMRKLLAGNVPPAALLRKALEE